MSVKISAWWLVLAFVAGSIPAGIASYYAEPREVHEAFNEGYEAGKAAGVEDAYHDGWHDGAGWLGHVFDPWTIAGPFLVIIPLVALFGLVGLIIAALKVRKTVEQTKPGVES